MNPSLRKRELNLIEPLILFAYRIKPLQSAPCLLGRAEEFAGVVEGGIGDVFPARHAGQFFHTFFMFQLADAGARAFTFDLFFYAEMRISHARNLR